MFRKIIGKKYYMAKNTLTEPFLIKLQAVIDADENLTISGLAIKAGLDNSAIRQMFAHDRSPRISTMRKICEALGTTLEEFMSNAQTPEEQQIVRLVSRLPAHLRQKLLSYGQGLLDAEDPTPPADGSADQSENYRKK